MNKFTLRKSSINGHGLFVNRDYKKGEFIGYIHGPVIVTREMSNPILAKNSMNWIGVGRYSWIDTEKSPFRYINHSCDPNVAIRGKRTVYALKDIKAGTEIVMDYSLTEADEEWKIACNCRSIYCRKQIGPISTLSLQDFKRNARIITPTFTNIYRTSRA